MKLKAAILIDTELPVPITGVNEELDKILNSIKEIENVNEAYVVYGRFDYVVHIEAQNYLDIVKTASEINKLENIRNTETLVEAKFADF